MKGNTTTLVSILKTRTRPWVTSAALAAMFGAGIYTAGAPHALAADVTYERLLNPEPQNWLSHPPMQDFSNG